MPENGGGLGARSPTLNAVVDAVPVPRLVDIQFYRLVGVIFLWLYWVGRLLGVNS